MIDKQEIISTLDTDEGKILIATYTDLYLKVNYPNCPMDASFMEAAITGIVNGLAECTVPDDFETRTFILGKLATSIQELEKKLENTAESIPPRPLPNGSRYLNPEEVNWLVKYDPEVKAAAQRLVKWFRKERAADCNYMDDDMIIETVLGMLYKLNRRDPEIVSQLTAPTPSFFKQYEEGTPEEIVIRYFNSYAGEEDEYLASDTNYSGSYSSGSYHSSDKADLQKQKDQYKILGIIFIFVFWPLAIYFFYKASQIKV